MDPKLGDLYIRQIIRNPANDTYTYYSWTNKLLEFEELKDLNLRYINLESSESYQSKLSMLPENTYGRTVLSAGWTETPSTSYLSSTPSWVITLGKDLSGSGYGLQIVIFESSNVIQMRRKLSTVWEPSWMSLGGFPNQRILPSGSDLNFVMESGYYLLDVGQYDNLPAMDSDLLNRYKVLEVFKHTNTGSITQRLTIPTKNITYTRLKIGSNNFSNIWHCSNEETNELKKYNVYNIINNCPKTSQKISGITYTWNGNICTVDGENTTSYMSRNIIYDNPTGFPDGVKPGSKLKIKFLKGAYNEVYVAFTWYKIQSGKTIKVYETEAFNANGEIVIPEDCVGLKIDLGVYGGNSVVNLDVQTEIVVISESIDKIQEQLDSLVEGTLHDMMKDINTTNIIYQWPNDPNDGSQPDAQRWIQCIPHENYFSVKGRNASKAMTRAFFFGDNTEANAKFPPNVGPGTKLQLHFIQGKNTKVRFTLHQHITGKTSLGWGEYKDDTIIEIDKNAIGVSLGFGILGTGGSGDGTIQEIQNEINVQISLSIYEEKKSFKNITDNINALINAGFYDIVQTCDKVNQTPSTNVNFTWNGNVCTVNGTNSNPAMTRNWFWKKGFPKGVRPGSRLSIQYLQGANQGVATTIEYLKESGASSWSQGLETNHIAVIPDDCIGLNIGLGVNGTNRNGGSPKTVTNAKVEIIIIPVPDSTTIIEKQLTASTSALISQGPDSFKPSVSGYLDLNAIEPNHTRAKPAIFLSENKKYAFVTYGKNVVNENKDDYPRAKSVNQDGMLKIAGQIINVEDETGNISFKTLENGTQEIDVAKIDDSYNNWNNNSSTFDGGCGLPSGAHGYQFFSSAFEKSGYKYNNIDNYGMRPCCRKINIDNTGKVTMGTIEELCLIINGESGAFDVSRINENNVNLSLYYTTAAPFYEESTNTWHWLIPVKDGFAYCTCIGDTPKNWILQRVFETPYQPICEISCAIFSDTASPTEDNKRLVFAIRDQKTGIYVGYLSADKTSIIRTYLIPSVSAKATLVKTGNSGLLLLNETNKKECSYIEIELRIATQQASRLTFTEWFKLFGKGTWYATIEQESIKKQVSADPMDIYVAGGNGDVTQVSFSNAVIMSGRLTFLKLNAPLGVVSAQKYNQNYDIK